jgi:hypothetical protein
VTSSLRRCASARSTVFSVWLLALGIGGVAPMHELADEIGRMLGQMIKKPDSFAGE